MTTLRERWGDEKYDAVVARNAEIKCQMEVWRLTSDADKIAQGNAMIDTLKSRETEINSQFPSYSDMPRDAWVCCHELARAWSHIGFLIRKREFDRLFHAVRHGFDDWERSAQFLKK